MTIAFSFSGACGKPVSIGGLLSLALFLLTVGGIAAAVDQCGDSTKCGTTSSGLPSCKRRTPLFGGGPVRAGLD